jgi:hypothetical protein
MRHPPSLIGSWVPRACLIASPRRASSVAGQAFHDFGVGVREIVVVIGLV